MTNAGSSLTAGGDLTITAASDINIQGSAASAGGVAALDAGHNITITPGYNGYDASYKREEKGIGLGFSAYDGTAKAQFGYHSDKFEATLDTVTVSPSLIQGGAGVTMNASNDINLQAALVSSPGDIALTAGHDINADVAYDTTSITSKHDELFLGVTAKVTQNVTGIISDMQHAAEIFNSGHGSSAYEAIGMASGVMKAVDTIATAAGGPRVSGSITIGGEGSKRSSYQDMAVANGTVLDAGGNLTLNAGNDVHLIGTQAHAGQDVSISAGHDVIIESAQSYASSGSKESSWNAGIGVGASAGATGYSVGVQIEGGFSNATNDSWGIQQYNSHVVADGKLTITSGNDTTLAGAVIGGSEVTLDVGHDLTIESRQDTGHSNGSSIRGGGSATIGAGVAGSGYGGGGYSESDVAWVTEQSGIYSSGKLDIYVENHTQLNGGVINSTTGDLTLDTGTLGFTTIKDHDTGSSFDMTVGFSYSDGNEKTYNYPWMPATNTGSGGGGSSGTSGDDVARNPQTGSPNNVWAGGAIEDHDREQDTNATVGAGTIIIRNPEAQQQDVAALNRDIDQAQVITKDESSGVQFYVSSQSVTQAAGGFQQTANNLIQAMNSSVLAAQVITQGLNAAFAAEANNGSKGFRELLDALNRGDITHEEILRQLNDPANCSGGGGQSGFNIFEFFVTTAHADVTCHPSVKDKNGNPIVLSSSEKEKCIELYQKAWLEQQDQDRAALGQQALRPLVALAVPFQIMFGGVKTDVGQVPAGFGVGTPFVYATDNETGQQYTMTQPFPGALIYVSGADPTSPDGNKWSTTNDHNATTTLYQNPVTGQLFWKGDGGIDNVTVGAVFTVTTMAWGAADVIGAALGKSGATGVAGAYGDLTANEIKLIQNSVNEAGRPLEVVGSAAQGTRRGVGTDLPIGKGAGTRSDIDYLVPPSSMDYFKNLQNTLPSLDPKTGIIPGVHNPSIGPVIRFEPH